MAGRTQARQARSGSWSLVLLVSAVSGRLTDSVGGRRVDGRHGIRVRRASPDYLADRWQAEPVGNGVATEVVVLLLEQGHDLGLPDQVEPVVALIDVLTHEIGRADRELGVADLTVQGVEQVRR